MSNYFNFNVIFFLCSPHFSNSLNKRIYGICNNPVEHSHEYVVEVFVRGMVDSSIGTVCSLSDIKSHLRKTVANQLNGKNLNTDIDFFKFVASITFCSEIILNLEHLMITKLSSNFAFAKFC